MSISTIRPVIVILSLFLSATTFATDSADQDVLHFQTSFSMAVQFGSVGEALTNYAEIGLITAEEKAGVENFLVAQKIALATKPEAPKIQGVQMTWNKRSVTVMPDGGLKMDDGKILRLSKTDGFDQTFIKVFNAMTAASSARGLFFGTLVPEAHAAENWGMKIGSAIGFALSAVFNTAATVVCGGIAVPFDFAVQKLSWIATPGFKVTCGSNAYPHTRGRYVMSKPIDYKDQLDTQYKSSLRTSKPGLMEKSGAVSEAACSVPFYNMASNIAGDGRGPSEAHDLMNDVDTEKAFGKKPAPKCNEENAEKLTQKLRADAKTAMRTVSRETKAQTGARVQDLPGGGNPGQH